MKKLALFQLGIFVFLSGYSFAQSFIYVDTINLDGGAGTYDLGTFDIANCEDAMLVSNFTSFDLLDVSFGSDDRYYAFSNGTSLESSGIYSMRISPNTFTLAFRGLIQEPEYVNALGCNGDGMIYAAGKGLSRYNVSNREVTYLGDLPATMAAAGDLTFRQGKMYLSTISNTLVEVDIENPMNSTVFMQFPPGTPDINGLVSYPISCDSTTTYAIGTIPDEGSVIYEIDFSNRSLREVCRTDIYIIGAASETECMPMDCQVSVDLDIDDSSGASGRDFQTDTVCYPSFFITGIDVDVFAEEAIDSITVFLTNPFDVGLENLTLDTDANVSIAGQGTTSLTIINPGDATLADFEQALRSVVFNNDAEELTYGIRIVEIIAYTANYVSEVARARLIMDNRLELEITTTSLTCFQSNDGIISLNPRNAVVPIRYRWEDGTNNVDNSRGNLAAGTYFVTVTDHAGCAITDTIQLTQPEPLVATITASADSVCGQSGELTAMATGGTAPYTFLWSDAGQMSAQIGNLGAGNYTVSVTDANGCETTAAYELFASDTIRTQEQITRCAGAVFDWNGIVITQDTSFCATFESASGCDSLHCVSVDFLDTVLVSEQINICQGETYNFNGLPLSRDTSICQVFTAANGCDSTYCFTLTVTDRSRSISASICQGESYAFDGQMLTESGNYTQTISDGGSCDSVIILNLNVFPLPSPEITIEGGLCEGGTATLRAGAGFTDYRWSTGATMSSIQVVTTGTYTVTVTDANGCSNTAGEDIFDTNLTAMLRSSDPTCAGARDGRIRVDSVAGGSPPYFYAINGQPFRQVNEFDRLNGGQYRVTVEDVNGCFFETTVNLAEPAPVRLDLGEDIVLALGDSIPLQALTNAMNPIIRWSPPDGLSCDSCLMPIAKPIVSTHYEATLTDANGCVAKDDLNILINRQEESFVPTAFSPNGDGVNDTFTFFAKNAIAKVNYFRVFDRWGNLLYQADNFTPNDTGIGWDGTFQGQAMAVGVYIYAIEIEKVDGITEVLRGEVALIR